MDVDEFLQDLEQAEQIEQIVPTDEFPYGIMAIGAVKDRLYPTQCQPTNLPLGLGPFGNKDLQSELRERFLEPGTYARELFKHNQQFLNRDIDLNSLMLMPTQSRSRMRLRVKRDLLKGTMDFGNYEEVHIEENVLTAKNSTSLKREPTNAANFVRGKSTNIPFIPGGFDVNSIAEEIVEEREAILDLNGPFESIPPGFDRGIQFEFSKDRQLNVGSILNANDELLLSLLEESSVNAVPQVSHSEKPESTKDVDSFLPETDLVLTVHPQKKEKKQREWAHMVDVNQEFPEFYDLVPEMAYSYPFELDVFQKRAVYHLEKSESVFIAAHTSAGKTVVAEYAIALAQKHMTRAIYTSPIKALSNQKFRDFTNTFDDVGILTGDIQIRPEAACLVMTTEILRSMLYRGADLIRDVEFVIFDEVHYVNDADRGVVWEEVIIMLPEHVTLILLSATVPNTKEFADWVGRTKQKDIFVISTLKRPVPLEHHLYMGKDLFKIVDSNKNFLQSGYKQCYEILNPPKKPVVKADSGRGRQKASRGAPAVVQHKAGGRNFNTSTATDKNMFVNLIGHLKKQNLVPAIVFAFSKKKCEEYAQALTNIDLTAGQSEKSKIHSFIEKSLSCLIGTDRELPQVLRMRELLSRGIAVHHSGLLPILKEIVEILFTMGLVKVLFATETFAMGLNCPARTVVFAMTRKHDGQNFRNLLPGEYTQMSGRAGRRGLDSTGMVIIACSDKIPDEHELRTMILGKPTKLESQFRVTYNMILNLLRVEAIKVEDMIKRSFSENATQKALPDQEELRQQGSKLLSKLEKLDCTFCNQDIGPFYETSARILSLTYAMNEKIIRSPVGLKALGVGRVVIVNNQMYRNCIGIILGPGKVHSQNAQTASRHTSNQNFAAQNAIQSDDKTYWVLILTDISNRNAGIFA
jgi:antiviral helicase SKI2